MEVIHTDKAPAAVGPYSQAVSTGKLLFLSGQIALNPASGKIEAQWLLSPAARQWNRRHVF